MLKALRSIVTAVVLAPSLLAWNAVGHRAVAGLAYDNLKSATRAKVDDLIRRHPDYSRWIQNAPADPKKRARYAFMKAANWADDIKGDKRFYDEARRDAVATPVVPGFPNMKQHRDWHYINIAFSTDGTPLPPKPPTPNALTELERIIPALSSEPSTSPTENDPVYVLPWLIHLAGDEHQPLHCATRFRKGQVNQQGRPSSDLGGNTVMVTGAFNLHAYWDDALGIVDSDTYLEQLIRTLAKLPKESKPVLEPRVWINEGAKIAQEVVYSFGNNGGTKDNPVQLDSAYAAKARETARRRAAIGGRRLAAVLNEQFK
jgi:hypothetical protein